MYQTTSPTNLPPRQPQALVRLHRGVTVRYQCARANNQKTNTTIPTAPPTNMTTP
jgi:hypothetical protein